MDIEKVARLARIELAPGEGPTLTAELEHILAYVRELDLVDTTDVPPTTHPIPGAMALRADVVGDVLDRDEVLAAAPAHDGQAFIVPKVL